MGIYEELMDMADDVIEDTKNRQEKERQDALEKELCDVHFKLVYDSDLNTIFAVLLGLALILFLKILCKPIVKRVIYGYSIQLGIMGIIALILIGLIVILAIAGPFYMSHRALPEIKGTMLYYKGSFYYARQITKIKVSSMKIATVYIDGKKCFWTSTNDLNYEAFLDWARKCNIPLKINSK